MRLFFCDFQTLWNCRGAFSCTFFIIKTYLLWRPARKRESVTATFDNRQKRNRHDNTSTTLSTIPLFLWPNRGSSFIFRPKAPLCAVMLDNWIRDSLTTVQRNTLKHSWFWPGKLSFIWLAKRDNLMLNDKFKALKTPKNRARENRKTLKRPKTLSKINFRNLKLKSHEEYLICRTYFVLSKTWFSS